MGLALTWVLAAVAASAQTESIFANGITAPQGGMILTGTGTDPFSGTPYRHLWTSDQSGLGLCRIDPDVASPGPHAINSATCLTSVAGIPFKPGQMVFDPLLNNIYAVDTQASTQGIFRLHFNPLGDGGHGVVDPARVEVIGGNGIGRNGLAGCGLAGNGPSSVSLGPDGNLYVGFNRSGEILRVQSPQTEPLPCGNVQVIGTTADNFKDVGLGWIGHDLYGGDGQSAWVIRNADQCMTPANGNAPCVAAGFLSSQTAVPSLVATDQVYPAVNGTLVFAGNPRTVTAVDATTLQVTPVYAAGFQLLSAIVPDPAQQTMYVADDPSSGLQQKQGHWWQVLRAAIPGIPLNVLAIAGAGSVNLQWTPAPGLTPISYIVHNSFVSAGAPIADVLVTPPAGALAPPTQITIDGLVNGISYQFTVAASTSAGTSRFSLPSRPVTPQAPTVPRAPSHVAAAGQDSSAIVAWTGTPAYQNGGFPVVVYKVEVQIENQNSGIVVTVPATPTTTSLAGALMTTTITGLTNGMHYRFVVRAGNQVGDSVPSLPSNTVVPAPRQQAQVPREPINVTAVAGDASATLSWTPPVSDGGSPILKYIIVPRVNNVPVPNVTAVPAPATSAVVSGLSNGTAYTFVVHAVNAIGDGGPSNPSNAVTPVPAQPAQGTVPGTPVNVNAFPGDASAFVTWTAPASNGGQPITNYKVIALIAGTPNGIAVTVPASATGTAVNGLSNGATYTFVVHALNAVGDSGPSSPSSPVTLPVTPAAAANLVISLSGPSTVTPASNAVFTLAVTNTGSAAAPHVTVTHAFTANAATFVANSTSQGSCSEGANALTCNLGSLAPGAAATINITLKITSSMASRAFVQATDASGIAIASNPAGSIARLKTMVASGPAAVAALANTILPKLGGTAAIPANGPSIITTGSAISAVGGASGTRSGSSGITAAGITAENAAQAGAGPCPAVDGVCQPATINCSTTVSCAGP